MRMRRSNGLAGIWGRAISRPFALVAPPGLFVLNGGASTAATATVQSASAPTGAVRLLQDYLSALAPAGGKLSKVEAALKALGPSATTAQVLAAVAPLRPALAPIERY